MLRSRFSYILIRYDYLQEKHYLLSTFPQDFEDLRALQAFWSSLAAGDVVTATNLSGHSHRAIVRDLAGEEVLLEFPDSSQQLWTHRRHIRHRLLLPWKPADLRRHLLIFRRRDAATDVYVEDLRVRRNLVRRLLLLLTLPGTWRQSRSEEPMHMYYSTCDWLSDSQMEAVFPDDGVPADLHMETFDETDFPTSLCASDFVDWLREGRQDCEVAQALLRTWVATLALTDSDTLEDLFYALCLQEQATHEVLHPPSGHSLSLSWLANFLLENCTFTFCLTTMHMPMCYSVSKKRRML